MTQHLSANKPLAGSIGTGGAYAIGAGLAVSILVAVILFFGWMSKLPDVYFSNSASVRSGEESIRECAYIKIWQDGRWVKIDCDQEILDGRYIPHWIE